MRLLIGEIKHEANTFSPVPTTLDVFRSRYLLEGQAILEHLRGTNTELGGFLSRVQGECVEVVPTLAATGQSGGPITEPAFAELGYRLLSHFEQAEPIDGVFLALHGAMVAQGIEDATGEILAQVRTHTGEGVPIVATLDLHANVTGRMAATADALIGYRTYPHVDMAEVGALGAEVLMDAVWQRTHPVTAVQRLPMIVPAENMQTTHGPMAELEAEARQFESEPGVLAVSVFGVQPWLDVPDVGCSVVVVTDDDRALGEAMASVLGRRFWALRHAFDVSQVPIPHAVRRAASAPGKPVILVDSADSTGSGSPGDATAILWELLKQEIAAESLVPVTDPEAAALAVASGIGAAFAMSIGGKRDDLFNEPVWLEGVVESISDGEITLRGPAYTGMHVSMGSSAVVRAGEIAVLLTSNPPPTQDPEMYRALGLEPREAQIVVVKSPNLFRAAYESFAHDIILVDSPGLSSAHIAALPYHRIQGPIFPLDRRLDWDPGG